MSDAFTHGLRANKDIGAALQAAMDALNRAQNAAVTTFHQIGSYAFATTAGHLVINPGDIVGGSDLRMAGAPVHAGNTKVSDIWSFDYRSAVVLPGSWRCMGFIDYTAVNMTAHAATLFVRVA